MDWANEVANRVVNQWVNDLLPRLNAIEMAALRDRVALQLRVERRADRAALFDAIKHGDDEHQRWLKQKLEEFQ